jgi:Mu transposase-like protein
VDLKNRIAASEFPSTSFAFPAETRNLHELRKYAGRYGFHAVPASVSETCLMRFDNNRYSVMANAVGRPVEIRAYADGIELRQNGGWSASILAPSVATRRSRSRHYVPVLARKPGALRNGAPSRTGVLPSGIDKIMRKLARVDSGNRQMASVLTAALHVNRLGASRSDWWRADRWRERIRRWPRLRPSISDSALLRMPWGPAGRI